MKSARSPRRGALGAASALALLLAGCAVGPDYRRPAVDTPVSWKLEAPWREGTPDDTADKGAWWKRFGDPALDALEEQAMTASPTLALANARLVQARAQANAAQAGLFPQIGVAARAQRFAISANRPLSNYSSPNFSTVQNEAALSFTVGYEVDLAGRVSRNVEGAKASAEQSAADFANTRLLLSADLAANYFNLRALDIELDVLARSIELQRRALGIVSSQIGRASCRERV